MRAKSSILLSLSVLTLSITGQAETPGVSQNEILLGQSAAFTGPSSNLAIELWRGAQLYFDKVNSKGGVHGRKIRVLTLDDQYDGDITLQNTIELLTKRQVFALFGYVGTPTLMKALPVLQKLYPTTGAFLFSNFTGAQPQRDPPHDQYVINIRASYREETEAIVDRLTQIGIKRIGLFIQDDSYGRSGADGTLRALRKRGLEPVTEVTYKRGTGFSESMAKQVALIQKAGVESVISVGAYSACGAFVRDARKAGFKGVIAHLSFVGPHALLSLLQEAEKNEGIVLTKKLINSLVVPPFGDHPNELAKEYQADQSRYDPGLPKAAGNIMLPIKKVSFSELEGYLNAKIFVSILKKIKGPLTRKGFLTAARKVNRVDFGLGKNNLVSLYDFEGLHTVFLSTIKNGEYVEISDWNEFK